MVVKSTATIAVTSESWDTDSPAGIVISFSVSASEPDEVDAADVVDAADLVPFFHDGLCLVGVEHPVIKFCRQDKRLVWSDISAGSIKIGCTHQHQQVFVAVLLRGGD